MLLGLAFTTGWVAFFFDSAPSRASLIVHASAGYAAVALSPWKSLIAARAIQRRRAGWWLSLLLSALVLLSVVAGVLHSTGILLAVGPIDAMEVHVGAALAALPLALWHVARRWIPVRAADLSRRSFLRGATLAAIAGGTYGVSEIVVRLLRFPGAGRRFTGSYQDGSLDAAALPVTQWLFDPVPQIDPSRWLLAIDAGGLKRWTYEALLDFDDQVRATLDCTGGFYSTQDWSGVWLSRLLPAAVEGSSIEVRSATGYARRFPMAEARTLLLATRLGGLPLEAGHGFPVRLVAPAYRGFWWVKWVSSITIDDTPAWWQLPFPVQ